MKPQIKYLLDTIRSKSEKEFVDKHPIERHSDRTGNKGDVFGASNISTYDRSKDRMGYNPGEDEMHYEAATPELTKMINEAFLSERHISDEQKAERNRLVMHMKENKQDFKKRYGEDWKGVMYATATKMAMKEEVSNDLLEHAGLDAMERYTDYHDGIQKMIGMLQDQLNRHKDGAMNHEWKYGNAKDHKGPHWGHIGDIRHAHDRVRELVDHFAANSQDVHESTEAEHADPYSSHQKKKNKRMRRIKMKQAKSNKTMHEGVNVGGGIFSDVLVEKLAVEKGPDFAAYVMQESYKGKKEIKKAHGKPVPKKTMKEDFDVVDQLRIAIFEDHNVTVTFKDGSEEIIDPATALSIVTVHESLNEENRLKMNSMIVESADGFAKGLDFVTTLSEGTERDGTNKNDKMHCAEHCGWTGRRRDIPKNGKCPKCKSAAVYNTEKK